MWMTSFAKQADRAPPPLPPSRVPLLRPRPGLTDELRPDGRDRDGPLGQDGVIERPVRGGGAEPAPVGVLQLEQLLLAGEVGDELCRPLDRAENVLVDLLLRRIRGILEIRRLL